MALPKSWLDELCARTPLPALIGPKVRNGLKKHGKEWVGLCPFHNERTPSFRVYEDHYHCFSCGAHGNAITFVMESQSLPFRDAVEQLAAAAGMEVPTTEAAAQAEQSRKGLRDTLTEFCDHAHQQLWTGAGRAALDYLRGRGLSDETIKEWRIGWIGREPLPERAVDAGLARAGETESDPPVPLFFDRVLFPIRDARGHIISVSGRALGERKPKYVNGADSVLFSKRRTLFGIDRLRRAEAAAPIVVEGQIDVITAHQAGVTTAVAPLGTALTEDQLELLWRAHPCPVICFDGDEAGQRAAGKVLETALPRLAPDRTLRFATMPPGQDPDQFIRSHGGPAFIEGVIKPARSFFTTLYDGLRREANLGTPEGTTAFRGALEDAAKQIAHPMLRDEYRRDLVNRLFDEKRALRSMRQSGVVPCRPVPTDDERMRQLTEVGSQIVEATARWAKDPTEQNERRLRAFVAARDEILRGDHQPPPTEELQ